MHRKLTFSIIDGPAPLHTRTIMELCDYLTDQMLAPRFAESGAHWEHAYMDFFTFDNTCDPLQPTGTIIFNVPPLFAGCVATLEASIVAELGKLGIKTGRITQEAHPEHPASVMLRIPIKDNPTVLTQPPEVNMSKTRGFVVLRDLLGYQPASGRYEFTADDLLKRLDAVTEQRITACTSSPVQEKKAKARVELQSSLVSARAVRRCLDELREFAEWAVEHKHKRLAAG